MRSELLNKEIEFLAQPVTRLTTEELALFRWKIWTASEFKLNADIATLYGEQFTETLSQSPRSGFIADGSPITVQKREVL